MKWKMFYINTRLGFEWYFFFGKPISDITLCSLNLISPMPIDFALFIFSLGDRFLNRNDLQRSCYTSIKMHWYNYIRWDECIFPKTRFLNLSLIDVYVYRKKRKKANRSDSETAHYWPSKHRPPDCNQGKELGQLHQLRYRQPHWLRL